MIENIKLFGLNQTLEIDRTKTSDFVLGTVNFGDRDTQYSLFNTIGLIGLERDIWYKRLSLIEIVAWAIRDDRDTESLLFRKTRLNHFVVPNTQLTIVCDGTTPKSFTVTESVRYGTSPKDNNEAFCKFMITGLYRQ